MSVDYFARYASLLTEVRAFNDHQVQEHGSTPQGVGWNGVDAQLTRFDQVLKVLPTQKGQAFSLNDIGCGYGALLEHLALREQNIDYRGYEVSQQMLSRAKSLHPESRTLTFKPLEELALADYSIASGIFGLSFSHSEGAWQQYVLDTLDLFNQHSARGFAFNMLTSYSDADKKRPELHYADPCFVFDVCKRRYSRNVALLHDYSLYDFTIIVRKA